MRASETKWFQVDRSLYKDIISSRIPRMATGGQGFNKQLRTHRWFNAKKSFGINVDRKAARMGRYLQSFRKELLTLSHACGYQHPCEFTGDDVEISAGVNIFKPLEELLGYKKTPVAFTDMDDYPSIKPGTIIPQDAPLPTKQS